MSSSPTLADNGPQAPRRHYDLMIIGTGSGNMIPGPEFNDTRIAIVEKGAFGGTCLNVGCIPTKMYVYAADIAEAARESEKFGIHAHVDGVDWPASYVVSSNDASTPLHAAARTIAVEMRTQQLMSTTNSPASSAPEHSKLGKATPPSPLPPTALSSQPDHGRSFRQSSRNLTSHTTPTKTFFAFPSSPVL